IHSDGKSRCGEGDVLSVPALHKNGTTTSVEFTVMPLKNESGAMIGMAAMMRDVTKRFEETRVKAKTSRGDDDSQSRSPIIHDQRGPFTDFGFAQKSSCASVTRILVATGDRILRYCI